ncbi:hypothetical protein A3A74_05185 [Candidatus Roizmanbacteria bacterium RIFCSPLOWO2_01_FULL_35_13]|uniref:Glycosyltransferase 2-like domain-containing protein n=1 Tax=Candidatus Roizmanbacteria bacterium RIFCSPLOWO2_01_FULL_35_13 TaxID=1802055 RepID=A0A1F7I7I8_9BACT|nr:MAG: hypothetical protein A3A74_05185 [Candidatus Roizmanbacteria bacterium RIFCSPLOWO2_01_FULL_35_13]
MKISAIIVVKNNPPHLFETLESIRNFVSEIIIGDIDIGNDYRKKLLENKKVRIVQLPSDIPFADLVKEDLKKQAKGEYILYLDPDEIYPSATLRTSPSLTTLMDKYDIFYFPRKNIIFGKWIEHSRWWPDYQLRLFKKESVIWPRQIHPVPKTRGKEYRFEAKQENAILHYNYDNLDQYLEKAIRYAKNEAQLRDNYSLTNALNDARTEFISRYFAGNGFKDGMHGFALAILQMFYYFLVYFYFWERKKYQNSEINIPVTYQGFVTNLYYESSFWHDLKILTFGVEKIKSKLKNTLFKMLK